MSRIAAAVVAAWLVIACSAGAAAGQSSFPDIQRILDNGKLLVAIRARNAPPMIMTDAQGAPTGSEADLARDIARKMGVAIEFVRTAETYDGVIDIVARKEADLGVSYLSSDVRRAKRVYFSRPYIKQKGRAFYNRASFARLRRDHDIDSIRQLASSKAAAGLAVGVVEGTVYAGSLERDFPQFALKRYPGLPEIMTAVRQGRIFAGFHGDLQVGYYMRQNPETAIYIAIDPEPRYPSDISVAVRPDSPNLLRWIDVYLDHHVGLMDTQQLIERYLNRTPGSK